MLIQYTILQVSHTNNEEHLSFHKEEEEKTLCFDNHCIHHLDHKVITWSFSSGPDGVPIYAELLLAALPLLCAPTHHKPYQLDLRSSDGPGSLMQHSITASSSNGPLKNLEGLCFGSLSCWRSNRGPPHHCSVLHSRTSVVHLLFEVTTNFTFGLIGPNPDSTAAFPIDLHYSCGSQVWEVLLLCAYWLVYRSIVETWRSVWGWKVECRSVRWSQLQMHIHHRTHFFCPAKVDGLKSA